jgi:MFS family permease
MDQFGTLASHPPQSRAGIARTTWLLISIRAIRSIGQGALVVDFALYLHALKWSAVGISAVLSASLLFGSVLTLLVGPLSDRIGRRGFVLAYEVTQMAAGAIALASSAAWLIWFAAMLGGFGRGGNGAAGPFSAVEQAWLAQSISPAQRGRVYSLNAASGLIGMAIGAVLAALPALLRKMLPGPLAYRLLFLLVILCSVLCFALALRGHDAEAHGSARPPRQDETGSAVRRRENSLIGRLVFSNLLNGAAIGLTGPLISYWFALRFGKGPELIGPMIALGFVGSALAAIATGRLSERVGVVRAVVSLRLVGMALMFALPFAPSFSMAAVIYLLRGVFSRGTQGARNALSMSIVRAGRRGMAASVSNVSVQIPRAIGPVFAGLMFEDGLLGLPFMVGALFQLASIVVYDRSFRNSDPSRPR